MERHCSCVFFWCYALIGVLTAFLISVVIYRSTGFFNSALHFA